MKNIVTGHMLQRLSWNALLAKKGELKERKRQLQFYKYSIINFTYSGAFGNLISSIEK